jgi:diguanylate cyclase (GGDEF)-like protein
VVLLSEIDQADQALAVAEKIRQAAAVPLMIAQQTISLQLSIGVSVYPDNAETADGLLKKADAAMYRGKALKRQVIGARSLVPSSQKHGTLPKAWCRRKTDAQFRA